MKNKTGKVFTVGLILLISYCNELFAQTDTIKTYYKQESQDSSDYNYHRKYQYLDITMKDETKIFKIATSSELFVSNVQQISYDLSLIFEKKINTAWSYVFIFDSPFTYDGYFNFTSHAGQSRLDAGISYYFFIKNKIKKGISGNNFNGFYMTFKVNSFDRFIESAISGGHHPAGNGYFDLNLGLQKRLSNYAYINPRLYLDAGNTGTGSLIPLNFGIAVEIGFAWGWK